MEYDYCHSDILSEFDAGKSITDGVSGRKRINTRYENTDQTNFQHTSNENTDDAMPDIY